MARLLKTDLNELFSFYETLSDKERELAVDRAYLLLLEKDDREALAYIAETLRQNLSDGELYKKMAKVLYGFHVLKKVIQPDIYLDRIAEYYEYALQLLPEEAEDISYSLLNVYSEQGDAEKAEKAWERLSDRKCDKK